MKVGGITIDSTEIRVQTTVCQNIGRARWNGQIPRNIKLTKMKSWRNRKPECTYD